MQRIEVNLYNLSLDKFTPQDVPTWLDEVDERWHDVSCCNWREYPYVPDVSFRICLVADGIIINYKVEELSVAALAPTDGGRVWEDSCPDFHRSEWFGEFIGK